LRAHDEVIVAKALASWLTGRWFGRVARNWLICSDRSILYVQNVPVGTYKRFYRNTVEIAENSENHLKAIVGGRQMAGAVGVSERAVKRSQKATGRRKSVEGRGAAGSRERRVLITWTCGEWNLRLSWVRPSSKHTPLVILKPASFAG
jgi:hypothetical protein